MLILRRSSRPTERPAGNTAAPARPFDQPRNRASARRRDQRSQSVPGKGSTFTFYLPDSYESARPPTPRSEVEELAVENEAEQARFMALEADGGVEARVQIIVSDDRSEIVPGDKVLLVVEDDRSFARTLIEIGHELGFKCLVAQQGDDA